MIYITVQIGEFFGFEDIVDNGQLADFFGLEVFRLVKHFTVTITQDIGREPSAYTQHTGLEHRSKYSFHQSLTALEVFTGNRHIHFLGEFPHSRSIYAQVRSTHDERSTFCDCSVSVAHARRNNFRIVFLHCLFQSSERLVLFCQRNINFSTCSPQHGDTVAIVVCLESADILTQLLYHVPTCSGILYVRTVQTFCKIVVKSGRHGFNGFQLIFYEVQVLFFQNLCIHCSFIRIISENVPTAKNDIVQINQRHYILNQMFFAVLHTHSSHLCD